MSYLSRISTMSLAFTMALAVVSRPAMAVDRCLAMKFGDPLQSFFVCNMQQCKDLAAKMGFTGANPCDAYRAATASTGSSMPSLQAGKSNIAGAGIPNNVSNMAAYTTLLNQVGLSSGEGGYLDADALLAKLRASGAFADASLQTERQDLYRSHFNSATTADFATIRALIATVNGLDITPPEFANEFGVVSLDDNADTGALVDFYIATDNSGTIDAYSMTGNSLFEIDPLSGMITTTGDVTQTTFPSSYVLNIQASDGSPHSSNASRQLTVNMRDRTGPIFGATPATATVSNPGASTTLSTIALSDPSGIGGVSITGGNDANYFNTTTTTTNGQTSALVRANSTSVPAGAYSITLSATDGSNFANAAASAAAISVKIKTSSACRPKTNFAGEFSVNGNVSGASAYISSGLAASTDRLYLTGQTGTISGDVINYNSVTGISGVTASYNTQTGIITFTGSKTRAQWEQVFAKVAYKSTASSPDATQRTIEYTMGAAVPFTVNGTKHYYEFVDSANINWTSARSAAAAKSLYGLTGYLATITTQAENDFIINKFRTSSGGMPKGWLGGSDSASEGTWRWVTGPEAGQETSGLRFWKGAGTSGRAYKTTGYVDNGSGASISAASPAGSGHLRRMIVNRATQTVNLGIELRFSNWSAGTGGNSFEPNNAGNEDYLQICGHPSAHGYWNDLRNTPPTNSTFYSVGGYYVEYGGMSGDTVPDLNDTHQLVPSTHMAVCGD